MFLEVMMAVGPSNKLSFQVNFLLYLVKKKFFTEGTPQKRPSAISGQKPSANELADDLLNSILSPSNSPGSGGEDENSSLIGSTASASAEQVRTVLILILAYVPLIPIWVKPTCTFALFAPHPHSL